MSAWTPLLDAAGLTVTECERRERERGESGSIRTHGALVARRRADPD
ncbi:hypothetical protein [uncultured Microbacterium sp.]|nr:hypothetical protein [uncultured Microbacterium sp.]